MAVAFLCAACGGGNRAHDQAAPAEAEAPAERPLPVVVEDGTITITGDDRMQFSVTEFTVPAGTELTVVFQNIGRMPKNMMGHNLLFLTRDADRLAFAKASADHPSNQYIAPELEDQVIATTRILGPGERESLTFTVPPEPGDYPYVCSFPGHVAHGMWGIMRVQ